jgi:uncharacterized Zn ribbon protein
MMKCPDCPKCGGEICVPDNFNDIWICPNCGQEFDFSEEDEDDDFGESLSVYEAADIYASNGKDEDYMFGYSEEELEDALNS